MSRETTEKARELMHIEEEAQPRVTGRGLWRRAPVWRWSLIGAAACTGLLLFIQRMPDNESATVPLNATHASQIDAATPVIATSPPSNSALQPIQNVANATPSNVVVAPVVQNQQAEPELKPQTNSCGTQIPRSFPPPQHHILKVLGFMPRQEALALIESTQKQAGMLISPRFVDNQRAMLVPISGRAEHYIVALVPQGMQVKVGDVVYFTSGFRLDPQYPCNYIPNLIDHVLATSAPAIAPDSVSPNATSNH